jgi:hypothetical protein
MLVRSRAEKEGKKDMTTMITLIGGQPQANVLPVLHYQPSDVVFVYTVETQTKYENLKMVLEKPERHIYGIETDPFNIEAIVAALSEWLTHMAELSSQPMVFNLTGGTKIMALAAYQIAVQYNAPVIYLRSERGQSTIERYAWQGHQLCWQAREHVNQFLNLHDILNLQFRQGKDDTREYVYKSETPNDLKSGWYLFDQAIAQVLSDHGYEVMCSVRDQMMQIDIDIVIRYQNQIGIIETKASATKEITSLKAVQQLNTAVRYLGGMYIRQILVINGQAHYSLQTTCDILHISLISLPSYNLGATSLSQRDSEMLLTEINRIMKVGIPKSQHHNGDSMGNV